MSTESSSPEHWDQVKPLLDIKWCFSIFAVVHNTWETTGSCFSVAFELSLPHLFAISMVKLPLFMPNSTLSVLTLHLTLIYALTCFNTLLYCLKHTHRQMKHTQTQSLACLLAIAVEMFKSTLLTNVYQIYSWNQAALWEVQRWSQCCRRTLTGKSITPKWCKYESSPEGLI